MSALSEQLASGEVARKTAHGAFALVVRQVFVQGAKVVGSIFLARLLAPGQFAFFAIVLYLQTFLQAFGDAGLAASLVRQHDEPHTVEYRSIFTVQQLLVFAIGLSLWLLSPWLAEGYHLPPSDARLFHLVAGSFLITSFMVIPQVRMERRLAFDQLAIIESFQAIIFMAVAVYLAWRGYGAYAFAWALLVRSAVGVGLANWISPWRLGWHWDWRRVRVHLSFGLSYQGIAVTSLIKDSITPVFIGVFAGTAFVGYITWAMMIAGYPVIMLAVLQRLYMPAFARLQKQKGQLVVLTENVIWATNAITAPLATVTLAMIVPITFSVYGPKWLVALPYFYWLWPANILACSASPIIGLLNALGKSRIPLVFSFIWMAGAWILGVPLIWLWGPIGFPISALIVQVSAFWLFKKAQREVPFRLLPLVAPVWGIAGISAALVYVIAGFYRPSHIAWIAVYGACGILVYAGGLFLLYQNKIRAAWTTLRAA